MVVGWISPLLVNGNTKLGKGVWTWSTLAGDKEAAYKIAEDLPPVTIRATCVCNCKGCYAQSGCFNFPSTKLSLAIKTFIARAQLDFMRRAIIAQIKADGIRLCRIHASGDFFGDAYVDAWRQIVTACTECVFWTYTKNEKAENAFNDLRNINVVKSCIPGFGFNFGHCDYILAVYKALLDLGKDVYICRCGIDKNQHCVNCKGCSKNEYVLFIEHSTAYVAEDDTLFSAVVDIVNAQPKP